MDLRSDSDDSDDDEEEQVMEPKVEELGLSSCACEAARDCAQGTRRLAWEEQHAADGSGVPGVCQSARRRCASQEHLSQELW